MNIAILPAGQWGSALAIPLSDNGHTISLWFRSPADVAAFQNNHHFEKLPGVEFPDSVRAYSTLEEAATGADGIIIGCNSSGIRSTAAAIAPHMLDKTFVLSIVKGFEHATNLRPSQVLQAELPEHFEKIACLGGPNFAEEVASRKPTATVIASDNKIVAESIASIFSTPAFKAYGSSDMAGVELGGALKNLIAIAAGICDGLDAGENARAAVITRGFGEICHIAEAYGAHHSTLYGLSGLGDLMLSSTGERGRNHRYGVLFAQGKEPKQETVEGIQSLSCALFLAKQSHIEATILQTLSEVLNGELPIPDAITRLMR